MKYLLLSLLLLNIGCASYQSGGYANVISGDHPSNIPISGKLDSTLTTKHYAVINFTFGNSSKEWLRVKKVRLDFNNEKLNKKANIVVGQDIVTWAESIRHKVAIDQWNKEIIWGSIALAGAVSAAASGSSSNSGLLYAGAGTYALTSGVLVANSIVDKVDDLERAKLFPRTHLYQSFSVPAGLYTNRWILLQIDKGDIPTEVYFDVEYLDGKKAKYKIKIKEVYSKAGI